MADNRGVFNNPEPPDDLSPEEQALAQRVVALRNLKPGPAFDQRMTPQQLQQRLRAQRRAGQTRGARSAWGTLQWAVLACVIALSFSGTSYAAAASLPGDRLYPLKHQIEQVQLGLTPAAQRPALLRDMLSRRLHELELLTNRKADPSHMTAAVRAYNDTLTQA